MSRVSRVNATVRERARDILRRQIAESVCDYFAAHGFEESTVDDAAQGVGISRATFFRYFGSKEEAIMVAFGSTAPGFAEAFREADLPDGLPAWEALHRALAPSVADAQLDADRIRTRIQMIHDVPALRARLAQRRIEQREALIDAVSERLDRATARTMCAAAIGVLDMAWAEWIEGPGTPLAVVLDNGFRRLASAGAQTLSPRA